MTYVFHRHTRTEYPTAVSGEGCYITDSQGKKYLDACGGAAVSCLGHTNAEVREAIHQQIDALAFAHTGFFTNEPMEALAEFLVKRAPEGIGNVYFVSGGSEAVEGAIKMARQYFLETGKPNKHKVIARWQSYHGNTLGALSAGGNRWRRAQFGPMLIEMHHISPCYAYRGQENNESLYDYGQRVANELEAKILEVGADEVAAFIAEPVVGATMGCVPAVEGYLKRIREICTQYDVLLILDEVMCGMGRTGYLFASEEDGVAADIITCAKGLGGGYQPIGAIMVAEKIFKAINQGSGFFQHGHTYMGHATACAASLAVNKVIEEQGLLTKVRTLGETFQKALEDNFAAHPYVGDIRGRGLFRGVEFVSDKNTKTPLEQNFKANAKIKAAALEAGLMCYPMGGTIDGQQGDHVMFAPPFIINENHIAEIIDKFAQALHTVFPEVGLKQAV